MGYYRATIRQTGSKSSGGEAVGERELQHGVKGSQHNLLGKVGINVVKTKAIHTLGPSSDSLFWVCNAKNKLIFRENIKAEMLEVLCIL